MISTQTAAWPASGADPSRSPFMLPPIDGAGHTMRRRLLQLFLADAQPAPRPVAAQETHARRIAVSDASRVGFVINLVSVATGVRASEITATTRLSAEAARAPHGRALRGVADRLLAVACLMLKSQTLYDPAKATAVTAAPNPT